MDEEKLYKRLVNLIPWNNSELDFRGVLRQSLKEYEKAFCTLEHNKRANGLDSILQKVDKVDEKINEIVKNSFKGLTSTAGVQMGNLLKYIDSELKWTEISTNNSFYRMRVIQNRRSNIERNEMFHIPLNLRRKVRTQRYSTHGYPCLYLGMSIYGCWEELGRPMMSNCWISRLENQKKLTLIDLRIPTENFFYENLDKYLVLFPLIIACMIPVPIKISTNEDVFKPEYIIPQLLIEWIGWLSLPCALLWSMEFSIRILLYCVTVDRQVPL